MKHVNQILHYIAFVAVCLLVVACSGIPGGNTGGGGGGGTVFTISAKVTRWEKRGRGGTEDETVKPLDGV